MSQEYTYTYIGVTELLMAPSKHPGCSGTRNLHDNISDLRAQVAANQKVNILLLKPVAMLHSSICTYKGITLVSELIDAYGLNVVQAYMKYIQVGPCYVVSYVCLYIGMYCNNK